MDFTNIFVILYIVGTLSDFILGQVLEFVSYLNRCSYGLEIPSELEGLVEKSSLEKTVSYKNACYRLWIPRNILSSVLNAFLLLSGVYSWVFTLLWTWSGNIYRTSIIFVLFSSLPGELLDLPFALYREFKIEKDFGFSNMTLKMWIADELKGFVLNLVLIVPLVCAAVAILTHAGFWWWLLLGSVYVAFTFVVSYVYPTLIAPVFNKFTPLPEGELKERLVSLVEKCGFHARSIFVMDASKRSGHSNAYFTGLGKNKRIVLYDTLIDQLSVDEIEAVLAHELGHYKHKHIFKKRCVMIPMIFAVLFILAFLVLIPELYTGFGFNPDGNSLFAKTASIEIIGGADGPTSIFVANAVPAYLWIFGIFLAFEIFSGFGWIASLIGNASSRRDEFQADSFSASMCGNGEPLVQALVKLNKENLSELCPPKIYCLFNYDHPPLLERIRAVRKLHSEK